VVESWQYRVVSLSRFRHMGKDATITEYADPRRIKRICAKHYMILSGRFTGYPSSGPSFLRHVEANGICCSYQTVRKHVNIRYKQNPWNCAIVCYSRTLQCLQLLYGFLRLQVELLVSWLAISKVFSIYSWERAASFCPFVAFLKK